MFFRKWDKHRRLWRLAIVTHPQKKSSGETVANPAVPGCGATARHHSLLSYTKKIPTPFWSRDFFSNYRLFLT